MNESYMARCPFVKVNTLMEAGPRGAGKYEYLCSSPVHEMFILKGSNRDELTDYCMRYDFPVREFEHQRDYLKCPDYPKGYDEKGNKI